MIKTIEPRFALTCYLRGGAHDKVIQSFAETGEFEKIVLYAQKVGHTPNYAMILTMVLRSQPDKAVAFAQSLVKDPSKPLVDVRQLVQVFLQNQVSLLACCSRCPLPPDHRNNLTYRQHTTFV